jgi:hypothetical protein
MQRQQAELRDAVAETFFQLLKRERIRQRIYAHHEQVRRNVFDYIEMFTTQSGDTAITIACLHWSLKNSIQSARMCPVETGKFNRRYTRVKKFARMRTISRDPRRIHEAEEAGKETVMICSSTRNRCWKLYMKIAG